MRFFRYLLLGLVGILFQVSQAAAEIDFSRVVTVLTKPVPADFSSHKDRSSGITVGLLLPGGRYVVAPYAKVREALFIEIVFEDGSALSARFRSFDRFTGLAFLELERQVRERRKLLFSRRSPSPGEKLYVVARPGRLEVYPGWVVRNPEPLKIRGYLRMDFFSLVSLAQEGVVFNSRGEFCGFWWSTATGREGEVLVLSSYTIRRAIEQFLEHGKVSWAWLGVDTIALNPSLARALDFPYTRGLILTRVYPRSPAERAGLKPGKTIRAVGNRLYPVGGDLILKADGFPVERPEELFRLILSKRPGEILKLELWRKGKKRYIAIKLSRRPER